MKKTFCYIKSDFVANKKNPKGLFICVLYRLAHSCVDAPYFLKPAAYLFIALYKILTEYIIGTEIHWRATIGYGLTVYHGYGLVVNSDAVLGDYVVLRHGVTIGVKNSIDKAAPVIGCNVDIGASALIIGPVKIGNGCKIGAGTVVVKNIPENSVVVGNPGRVI